MRNKKYLLLAILAVIALLVVFVNVFAGAWILPQSLEFGPISIRIYGIIIALAVLASYYIARRRTAKFNLPVDLPGHLIVPVVIAGFIGARLFHIVSSYEYYAKQPLEIFQVWHGGLGIYGAVLGGIIALIIAGRRLKIRPLVLFDWLVPATVVAQIIGRLGNFFNYELYGYATNLPWKMFVPQQFRLGISDEPASYYHPLFLYEMIWLAVMLLILRKVENKNPQPGTLFLWYIFLYNSGRFFLEFIRLDTVYIGSLRQNALVSAVLALISLGFILYGHYRHLQTSQAS